MLLRPFEESLSGGSKVLLTSPTRTAVVRQPFPDDLALSMEGMAWAYLVISSLRLVRKLSR